MDAEKAHHLTLSLFKLSSAIPLIGSLFRRSFKAKTSTPVNVMGLAFPNRIGLAAGFDKEGSHTNLMSQLGFGFIEVGTVTPKGQSGNPKPRLFRLPEDRALINRMGFNNAGLDAFAVNLQRNRPSNVIIGANIGKNKVTPNEEALSDYETCFEQLFPYADYFVVNVSSPNTPGLRELQSRGPLLAILARLQEMNEATGTPKPILLKIAPDLNEHEITDIASIIKESGVEGIIATNTTIDRSNLQTSDEAIENIGNGGLSGDPLRARSTEVIRQLRSLLPNKTIIGVGGISSPEAALEKLEAGADLIQIYSGLIYEGPWLVRRLVEATSAIE